MAQRGQRGAQVSEYQTLQKEETHMKHYHPWFSDTLIPRQFGKLAESFGCGLDGITRIRLRSIWRGQNRPSRLSIYSSFEIPLYAQPR